MIFYDITNNPIDVDIIEYHDIIPAGLAKRVTDFVDSSVRRLTNNIEIRILDFKIVE